MARFSVVVPTRDRPDLLNFCLEGLAAQTFEDVEVVVSDNPVKRPAQAVFDRWARPGWRYVSTDRPVPMHDNFERGCAEATGEYVSIVIDKTVLHPSALEVADRALTTEGTADIVTWWNEGYNPVDEAADLGSGRFLASAALAAPSVYEPAKELARRFENASRRGADPVHYVRGKIVFGAYSRTLLDRIQEVTGRVFHPLAPDYTAMVPACVLSEGALDVGRPLLVSYNSRRSNGRQQAADPVHARRFIEGVDPAIIEALPIPGLYTSPHNVVAYDLVSSAARCPAGSTPALDLANLAQRAREDLEAVGWTDRSERDTQYAILEAAEARLGVVPTHRTGRNTRAALVELAARLAGRTGSSFPIFASPVEAARSADRHYAAQSSP